MNTRLKELMLKAGYAAPELAGRATILAKLIVEECISILDEDDGATHHTNLLEEHFGDDHE